MSEWENVKRIVPLEPGAVHVWRVEINEQLRSSLGPVLSEAEKERAAAFKFRTDQTQFIVARASLRFMLSAYLGHLPQEFEFYYARWGKPYLACQPLHFNVAHSGEYALLAFCLDREVGVDIEKHEPSYVDEGLTRHCFTPREKQRYDQIVATEKPHRFFDTWAGKEAYMKLLGDGLNIAPDHLDLLATSSEVCFTPLPVIEGYSSALATQSKPLSVDCYAFASSVIT